MCDLSEVENKLFNFTVFCFTILDVNFLCKIPANWADLFSMSNEEHTEFAQFLLNAFQQRQKNFDFSCCLTGSERSISL